MFLVFLLVMPARHPPTPLERDPVASDGRAAVRKTYAIANPPYGRWRKELMFCWFVVVRRRWSCCKLVAS